MNRMHSIVLTGALASALAAGPAGAEEPATEVTLVAMSHAAGVLPAGEKETRQTFAVDAPGDLAFVIASPARLAAEVRLPDGRTVDAERQDRDTAEVATFRLDEPPASAPLPGLGRGEHTVVRLMRAPAGAYELRLATVEPIEQPIPFAVTMLPSSALRLGLVLPETEIPTGQAVAVSALLFDEDRPVGDASVVALAFSAETADKPASPVELTLRDDGELPDAAAGDGIFTGLFAPERAGAYTILVRARGRAGTGLPFERDTAGSLTVRDRRSRLAERYESEAVDADRDGGADALVVRSTVAVDHTGLYDLAITLRADNGRTASAHTLSSLAGGEQTLDVVFGAEDLRPLAAAGPYTLALVRLDEIDETGSALVDRQLEAGVTVPVTIAPREPQ